MMEYRMDGYCGLYCGACPIMLETKVGKASETCHSRKSDQVIELYQKGQGQSMVGYSKSALAVSKLRQFLFLVR